MPVRFRKGETNVEMTHTGRSCKWRRKSSNSLCTM